MFLQIKHLYTAIENFRNQSEFPLDDDHGAGIEGAPSFVDDEYDEGFDEEGDEREDASTAIALVGLQGSINQLTDNLIKSMTAPEGLVTTRRAQAVKRVDDGLSTKGEGGAEFQENEAIASTYLSLRDQALRQAWIRTTLESVFSGPVM